MLLRLHANLYAYPASGVAGPEVTLRGLKLPTLRSETGGPPPFLRTLPVTFEAMQQGLAKLQRCDYEPDGFFLVTGHAEIGHTEIGQAEIEQAEVSGEAKPYFWRLNGHMHEYQAEGEDSPRMHRIELHGECPVEAFDAVLATVGWPSASVVFELVEAGVTLDEASFRQFAAAAG